jgi:hypothetical protein
LQQSVFGFVSDGVAAPGVRLQARPLAYILKWVTFCALFVDVQRPVALIVIFTASLQSFVPW